MSNQEEKADASRNPSWKEVWDDVFKDSKDSVELALNYIIVLHGTLTNLPEDLYVSLRHHGLDQKYSRYLQE